MSEKRQQRIEAIFQGALEVADSSTRAAYVREAAKGDEAVIEEVARLLAADASDAALVTGAALGEVETEALGEEVGEPVGSMVGPYKLLQQVGEGGFGAVYMAEQEKPVRRRVALKIIKSGMDTKQVVARFEAERQALAIMDHANIARVFDGGATEQGRPYFVMELVRGMPITAFCDEQKLSTEDRLQLFMDVCAAVQHAHQKGIIHRDLKPSNVLITVNDGRPVPKVIDFGIAKATEQRLTDKTLFTRMEQAIGTPDYMSPEQAGMSSLDVDTRSDVYSLGVMLYVLLTGEKPFDWGETSWDEIKRRLKDEEPQKPSTKVGTLGVQQLTEAARRRRSEPGRLGTQLKGDLDWIVLKAMEKDRERRYETANALRLDIQRYLDGDLVTAVAPSLSYRWSKFVQRNQRAVIVGTAFAMVMIVATAVSSISAVVAMKKAKESREMSGALQVSRDEAIRNQYVAHINLADQMLRNDNLGRAKELLDGLKPQAGEQDLRGWEWRFLKQQALGDESETLIQTSGIIGSLDVSPDRRWIVFTDQAAGRLVALRMKGRDDVIDLVSPEQSFKWCRPVFSPVNSHVAYTFRKGDQMWVGMQDVESQRMLFSAELALSPPAPYFRPMFGQPIFSGDGRRLLTAVFYDDSTEFSVWDLETKRVLRRCVGPRAAYANVLGTVFTSDANLDEVIYQEELGDGELRLLRFSLERNQPIWSREITDRQIFAAAIDPGGERIAAAEGLGRGFIHLLRRSDGELIRTLDEHKGWVGRILFADANTLVSASADQTIRIWDVDAGECVKTLKGHEWEVRDLVLLRESNELLSASKDGTIRSWTIDTSRSKRGRFIAPGKHRNFAFSLDSRSVYLAGEDGSVRRWEIGGAGGPDTMFSTDPEFYGRFYELNGQLLFVIQSGQGRLDVWDVASGERLYQVKVDGGTVFPGQQLYANQEVVFLIFMDQDVLKPWRIGDRKVLPDLVFKGRNGWLNGKRWETTRWVLVRGSDFGSRLFQLSRGVAAEMDHAFPEVYGNWLTEEGDTLLLAEEPGVISQYYCDVESNSVRKLKTFSGSLSGFRSPILSRDQDRLFALSAASGAMNVWDFESGQKLLSLKGDEWGGSRIKLSSDGSMIGATGRAGAIMIWRAPSMEELEGLERLAEDMSRPRRRL